MKLTKTNIAKIQKDPAGVLKGLTDDEIGEIITAASHSYYNDDKPIFTDDLFDLIKETLQGRNAAHPALKKVGAPIAADDNRKEELPYYMGSLDKIKDSSDKGLDSFKKKYPGEYVVSDKLDGNSGLVYVNKGAVKLFTRGDGTVGQNVSAVIQYIQGVPNLSSHKGELAVRGELIISKKNFTKLSKRFANARNAVAGAINAKRPEPDVLREADFVAYELVSPKLDPAEQLPYLEKLGFKTVYNKKISEAGLTSQNLSDILLDRRDKSPYEIDGIVIMHNKIHRRVNGKNPEYGFAFKSMLTMESAEVVVTNIEWNLSKDGYLVPTVLFNGVSLDGVVIKRATGFNGKFIKDNKIGPGSRLTIIRSGAVIPYVKEILTPAASGQPQMPDVPFVWSKSGVDIMIPEENKKDNDELRLKNLENFVKKIDVPGLGPGNIKKMFEAGFDNPKSLFAASAKDLLKVDGFKDKTAQKIHDALQERKKTVDCLTLMDASNAMGRGLGSKKLKVILDAYPTILEKRYVPTITELVALKGVEKTTAELFAKNLPAFFKFVDDNGLDCKADDKKPAAMEAAASTSGPSFEGQKIVFTGFRNKELEDYIAARGGEISSGVSKKTTLVVCKDLNEDSSKIKKAKELGVPLAQVDDFIKSHKIKL